MKYLSDNPVGDVNIKAFEESCGVGVVVTLEQIKEEVEKVLAKHEAEIQEKRFWVNTGQLTAEVMNALEWGERKVVKSEVDLQLLGKLGPKTEADLAPPKAEKTPKQPKPSKASADDEKEKGNLFLYNFFSRSKLKIFFSPGYQRCDFGHRIHEIPPFPQTR